MTRAADDFAFIKARQDEIARETQERIAGQPLPIDLPDPVPEEKPVYGMYGDIDPAALSFWQGREWTPEQQAGIKRMSAYAQMVENYRRGWPAYQAPDSDPA